MMAAGYGSNDMVDLLLHRGGARASGEGDPHFRFWHTRFVRSKVAEEIRAAQRIRMRAMTPAERVAQAERMLGRDLEFFMAGQQVSRDVAIRRIRRSRQTGRRKSRCMRD